MTILVVGASGATGRLLVEQLLNRGHCVKAIVRSPEKLPPPLKAHAGLSLVCASILELSDEEMAGHVSGCDAVASCLGHTMNWKGIYGHPRKLVTDATRRLCDAIKASKPEKPARYVLMNTAGNRNLDLPEPISFVERCVVGLIRLLVPPHLDNEQAAEYLRSGIGKKDKAVEWAAVRPIYLTDEDNATEYEVFPSPIRSAIFGKGSTSRINVAHFMASLITDDDVWNKWKGQMPVIYNAGAS
ncbi:MAG: SDR family oxidoreductase [Lewinellaceae bacterium]|nr:SDR family oxidoreductase [Lewinellaceae bacterium]MCB9291346.1 SDR family oxidoreductase [Lewinellaceae bacterium]